MDWRPTSPPRQDGRIFAVTGGNAGIGYFISEQLASTGATVVILGRNLDMMNPEYAATMVSTGGSASARPTGTTLPGNPTSCQCTHLARGRDQGAQAHRLPVHLDVARVNPTRRRLCVGAYIFKATPIASPSWRTAAASRVTSKTRR